VEEGSLESVSTVGSEPNRIKSTRSDRISKDGKR